MSPRLPWVAGQECFVLWRSELSTAARAHRPRDPPARRLGWAGSFPWSCFKAASSFQHRTPRKGAP